MAGPDGLVELITETRCDLVLNAIVGSAGLVPTVATVPWASVRVSPLRPVESVCTTCSDQSPVSEVLR